MLFPNLSFFYLDGFVVVVGKWDENFIGKLVGNWVDEFE